MILADITDVTPGWLTEMLTRDVAITGDVTGFAVEHVHDEQLHSVSYHLRVVWSNTASANAPTRLFLKLPRHPDEPGNSSPGAREVRMYHALAPHAAYLPIIPCYSAAYIAERGQYHLLLADLRDTHEQPAWHLSIAQRFVEQTMDCLAQLHAYWWENTALPGLAALPSQTEIATDVARVETHGSAFIEQLGELLAPADVACLNDVVGQAREILMRRRSPQRPTLVHGDAHFWNFLYPRVASAQPTYILDWQQHHIGSGVSDLAYTLVLRDPHRTREREKLMVRRYHERLCEHGVTGYSWEQCWHDYREAALEQLLVPIVWFAAGLPEPLWRPCAARALAAFCDLNDSSRV